MGPTVKLYWRLLEVYFSVNDVHRVILGLLVLYFCKTPCFALLIAASQPRGNRVDQALYEFHKKLGSLSLSFSGASLVVDQEPAGSIEQLVSYL